MNLTLSDEQQELARTVDGFLDKYSPESEVRRPMECGGAADPEVWRRLTQQLGLQGLTVPEKYGGGGFGYLDMAVVLEAAGGALLVAPLLSSVLAASALADSDDESSKREYLPGLAAGAQIGTVALAEDSGRWDLESITVRADLDGDGHRLHGVKSFVVDGYHADVFVVSARTADGVGLFVVDAESPRVSAAALKTLDATRPQARIELDGVLGRPLSTAADGDRSVRCLLAIAGTLLAAEQAGGARHCLNMAVDYAKVREQFGKPIGSFQAVKHKCADMLVNVESARSAAYYAASVLDDGSEDPGIASALAQAHCSAAYTRVAGENIQIHGGVGFTWGHPAQLYFKRAKTSEMLFGDPATHRERLAELVGI